MINSHTEMKKRVIFGESYDQIYIETADSRLEVDLVPQDKSLITFEYTDRRKSWVKFHKFDFSLGYYRSPLNNPNITGQHNSGFYSFSTT